MDAVACKFCHIRASFLRSTFFHSRVPWAMDILSAARAGEDLPHRRSSKQYELFPTSSTSPSTLRPDRVIAPPVRRPPPSLQLSDSSFEGDTYDSDSYFSSIDYDCLSSSSLYPASSVSSRISSDSYDLNPSEPDLTPWISSQDYEVEPTHWRKREYRASTILANNTFYLPPLFPDNPSITRQHKPSSPPPSRFASIFRLCTSSSSVEPLSDPPRPAPPVKSLYISLPSPLKRAASRHMPPPSPWRAEVLSLAVDQCLRESSPQRSSRARTTSTSARRRPRALVGQPMR